MDRFHYLIAGVAGGVQLLHLVAGEFDTPRAQERDGTLEEIAYAFVRPDAMVGTGECIGHAAVCIGLSQYSVLVDVPSRTASGNYEVYPGKIEAGRVPVKGFIIWSLINPPGNSRFFTNVVVVNTNPIIVIILAEIEHRSTVRPGGHPVPRTP